MQCTIIFTIGRVRPVTFEESSRAVSAPLPCVSPSPRQLISPPCGLWAVGWAGMELPPPGPCERAAASKRLAALPQLALPLPTSATNRWRERRTSHTTLITTHFLSLSLRPIDPGLPPPAPADRSPRLASYPAPSSSDARAEEFDPSARGKERETKEREGQTDRSGRYR